MRHCLAFWHNVCHHIVHWVFLSNICSDYFITSSVWNGKIVFFRRLYSWLSLFAEEFIVFFVVCLYFFWCSCVEAPIFTTIVTIVKHVFKRNLTCLTQLFDCFSLLFFIVYPQYFLSWRVSDLVHPHRWSLILLKMENMCLHETFTSWEGSSRKNGSGTLSSSFNFDDFRTWPWEPLDGCLITARIVLP